MKSTKSLNIWYVDHINHFPWILILQYNLTNSSILANNNPYTEFPNSYTQMPKNLKLEKEKGRKAFMSS